MSAPVYATWRRAELDAGNLARELGHAPGFAPGDPLPALLVKVVGSRHAGSDALLLLSDALNEIADAAFLRGERIDHLRRAATRLAAIAATRANPIEDPAP